MDDREAFRRTQEEASKKFKAKKAKRNAVKRLALSNLSYKHKKNGTKEAYVIAAVLQEKKRYRDF